MAEPEINDILIGADLNKNFTQIFSYENRDYTFKGELKNYNYTNLLKDKQNNINKFYELANYYIDSDAIYSGIIKRVLVPFSLSCGYKLKGTSERVKNKYLQHYENVNFLDTARSIFYELYTFANCYIYFMPNGNLITLPPHKIRISDVMTDGEPVIEFNIAELNVRNTTYANEKFIDTLKAKYQGYPPEITESLEQGNLASWIQLNPENTFVLQESKPLWQKYAIPFISTCLKPLAKKELISYYEDVQLNIGAKGFLHVKLGDNDLLPKPTKDQLNATARIFQDALNKFPLAVTSHFVEAQFISVDNQIGFDNSRYADVNEQILASGGIAPLIVTGESDGSSFAQANVSVEIAAKRIMQNQDNFSEMMKKYNRKLAELWRIGENKIPKFAFNDVDLANNGTIKQEAFQLWQQGCISRKTLLDDYYDMDYEQEKERKNNESKNGDDEIFTAPANPFTSAPVGDDSDGSTGAGRPQIDDTQRTSDKNKTQTGKQPKPSNKG